MLCKSNKYIKKALLFFLTLACCLAVTATSMPGTQENAEDKLGKIFDIRAIAPTRPQQFQESSSFTLPEAVSQTRQDPLTLGWQLRLVSTPGAEKNLDSQTDASQTASDAEMDGYPAPTPLNVMVEGKNSADPVPDWLSQSPLWLFISVAPGMEGSYFYAPFASGQNSEEIKASAAAVLPTSLEILGAGGEPLTEAVFFYPPGSLKEDYFSGLELPTYQDATLFLAAFPASLMNQPLTLKLNALICTESSCTPFRKNYELKFESSDILTAPLTEKATAELAFYRSAPFISPDEQAIIPDKPFSEEAHTQPPLKQDDASSILAEYISELEPRYHQESLEVASLGRAVLLGLLAGLILNFMPCVLPVITLKIGSLLGLGGWSRLQGDELAARAGRRRFRIYAFCFSLGIFVWFGMLFVVIGLAELIWGQFFQSQTLILALTFLLFILSLSLLGLLRLPVLHTELDSRAPMPYQAFLGGLLATLLATPCSGPLLGGVLGWAVDQSLPYLALTLASVAVGMASPFLLMVIKPDIARLLPKPGPWTKKLEVGMSFVLLGTVIYLLSMLPQERLLLILTALLTVAFSAWLWSLKKSQPGISLTKIFAVVLAASAIYLSFIHHPVDTRWQNFEAAHFEEQLGQRNILLDFTADWCINCRAMEITTLTEQRLADWGKKHALLYIKVDLTGSNPDGEALLGALGSASIPLLAIIPADSPHTPTVLRDIVTPGQLDAALKEALGK